ncbi:MAG TPA: hypothetical protein VF857_00345, partial [Spirochaetota bacterium]
MAQRTILVADDIENQTDSGKQRSKAILSIASFLARRLKSNIDLMFVEDLKTYPARKLGSFRFPEWHDNHEKKLKKIGAEFTAGPPSTMLFLSPNASERASRCFIVCGT